MIFIAENQIAIEKRGKSTWLMHDVSGREVLMLGQRQLGSAES